MPTYYSFNASHPNMTASRTTTIAQARYNDCSLRDGLLYGGMEGFNYSFTKGTGTNDAPQYFYFKNGNNWLQILNTWTGSQIDAQDYYLSADGGGTYATIGHLAYTWDASSHLTATTWS